MVSVFYAVSGQLLKRHGVHEQDVLEHHKHISFVEKHLCTALANLIFETGLMCVLDEFYHFLTTVWVQIVNIVQVNLQ